MYSKENDKKKNTCTHNTQHPAHTCTHTYTKKNKTTTITNLSSGRLLPPSSQSRRQVELERVATEVDPNGARRVHAHGGVEGAPDAAKRGAPAVEGFAVEGEEDVGAVVPHAVVESATDHITRAKRRPAPE